MSKELGLDWAEYEYERIHEFRLIMSISNKLKNQDNGRNGSNTKNQGTRGK